MSISQRLKEALTIRGMKQSELSKLTGIGKSSISTYLSGEYEPKRKNIYKLAEALNVNESWLIGDDVPMEPSSNAENMLRQFQYISKEMSDFPKLDLDILNIQKLNVALKKVNDINNAIINTPRICCLFDSSDAILGLKFIMTYYNIPWENYSDTTLNKIVESQLFKDFIQNLLNIFNGSQPNKEDE